MIRRCKPNQYTGQSAEDDETRGTGRTKEEGKQHPGHSAGWHCCQLAPRKPTTNTHSVIHVVAKQQLSAFYSRCSSGLTVKRKSQCAAIISQQSAVLNCRHRIVSLGPIQPHQRTTGNNNTFTEHFHR
jgi:hypothetical protein